MQDKVVIQQKLEAKFGQVVSNFTTPYDLLTLDVQPDHNLKVLQFLNEDKELGFTFLTDLTAVHYPDNVGKELTVVYLLQNLTTRARLRLKCHIPIEQPDIFTATSLYSTSNWLERECYDFFGVNFKGHPDLRRIVNVDEMDYFPLRKEYPLEDQTRTDKDDEMFGRISSQRPF